MSAQQRMETGATPLLPLGWEWPEPPFLMVSPPPSLPACPQVVNQVLDQTSSGNFGGNEGFVYLTLSSMPLGGVGESFPPSRSSPHP